MVREKTRVSLEIPLVEKEILELFAKSHGMSLSKLFRKGARLYGAFGSGFLEAVGEHFRERGIQVSTALELSLQKRVAAEKAWKNVFVVLQVMLRILRDLESYIRTSENGMAINY